jgi:tetratricopeptide (TPR) repeat protein
VRASNSYDPNAFMKHGSAKSFQLIRLMALAAVLSVSASHADEYSDVSQLMRAGKMAEAQARVDRYLAAKPRDPQMRFIKGVIQRDSGRLADAIITFTQLTEDHPELPEPYNNMAVIYASLGQNEKARAALEMAIRTNPSYATAHENLGDVYAKLASQAYNKALQIDSANTAVQPKLALIRELFNPAVAGQRAAPLAPTAPIVQAAVTPPRPSVTAPSAKLPAPTAPTPTAIKPAVTATAQPAASSAAPAARPPTAATPQPAPADGPAREVQAAVHAWAKAWADKNMAGYLGAYGQEFAPPGQLSRSAWEQERRLRITGKARISVSLLNLSVTIQGNRAVAKFQQDYKADSLAVLSRKTLELVKTGDRWMIVKETSGA